MTVPVQLAEIVAPLHLQTSLVVFLRFAVYDAEPAFALTLRSEQYRPFLA